MKKLNEAVSSLRRWADELDKGSLIDQMRCRHIRRVCGAVGNLQTALRKAEHGRWMEQNARVKWERKARGLTN